MIVRSGTVLRMRGDCLIVLLDWISYEHQESRTMMASSELPKRVGSS